MKIPGAFWIALLLALGAATTQYFQGPWVPIAVAVIGVIVKAIQVYYPQDDVPAPRYVESRSKLMRFIMGG